MKHLLLQLHLYVHSRNLFQFRMSLHLLLESNHTAENTAATTAGGRLIPSENTLNIVYYKARSLLPKLDDLKETESQQIKR